ncbi:methyltransferase domain-containing protein [Cupriavidus sp. KK10]|uniref:class I SAM-dependent methyltransferase n=1 Tax=Cupriavidus sp. KK10 TaxID=1478019 RepID=UPI001BA7E0E4|nr:class I SAM-dependent methyltransferase [Cupriavidus sp. KK10]QUN27575.1 methyltransferase domain-containing protein [Cupriavidus sp. KK10]
MFLVPTIPNSPLSAPTAPDTQGEMRLRRNRNLDFIENAAFDPTLAEYDDNYQNSQAYSEAFQAHMSVVLRTLERAFPAGATLVEVGCGKGDFVELAQASGHFKVSGYDATYEGTNPAIEKRYLDADDRIKADLVVLRHVLEHVRAPHKFLAMLKEVFSEAKAYIEVPSWDWIAENKAFFDITYEHVNYFSRNSLRALFDGEVEAGLCFNDQYQYVVADISKVAPSFEEAYCNGEWVHLAFADLFPSVPAKIAEIESHLQPESNLYIWGAATKGCMFLVHCSNQRRLVDRVGFAVDVNPQKCGKYLPGSHVAIRAPADFFAAARDGDVLLVSNPNYQAEIKREIARHGVQGVEVLCL